MHAMAEHERPPCAARPSPFVLDRDGFGFRLLRSRILLMCLATLQLAVSIGPEGDVRSRHFDWYSNPEAALGTRTATEGRLARRCATLEGFGTAADSPAGLADITAIGDVLSVQGFSFADSNTRRCGARDWGTGPRLLRSAWKTWSSAVRGRSTTWRTVPPQ